MKAAHCLLARALLTGTAAAVESSANERLYFRAQDGDAGAQVAISNLLLMGRFRPYKNRENPQDEGVKFLYLAAMHDNVQAKERMAVLARDGKFGIAKIAAAAACWTSSAQGKVPALQCVELSKLTRPRVRPTCSEVTQLGRARPVKAADGEHMATLCIANGTLSLFIPGGPPSNATEM